MCCNKDPYPRQEPIYNALLHTAQATRDFLENQDVGVMGWPSKSLDMYPMEHHWDQMAVHIHDMDNSSNHGSTIVCGCPEACST